MSDLTKQEIEMLKEVFRKNINLHGCHPMNLQLIYRTPGYGERIVERLASLGYFKMLPDYHGNGMFNGKKIKSEGLFLTRKGLDALMGFYGVGSYDELVSAFIML